MSENFFTKSYAINRIAELQEEIENLKFELEEKNKKVEDYQNQLMEVYSSTNNTMRFARNSLYKLTQENLQLKQQLHDLPKKIVEDMMDNVIDVVSNYNEPEDNVEVIRLNDLQEIIDTILNKYTGAK